MAIETSMGRTSVAVTTGRLAQPLLVQRLEPGHGQAERLIPLIRDIVSEAAISYNSLDLIAVCVGPGGFSGIRTGVAAARAIGLAANVSVAGATSFRIMTAAFEQQEEAPATYALVAPAGLNAVYCQIIARGALPITDIVALPHHEVANFLAGKAEIVTGPASAALCQADWISLPIKAPDLFPDAAMLAKIAPSLDPECDRPSPFYVRPADAKPQTGHLIARKCH